MFIEVAIVAVAATSRLQKRSVRGVLLWVRGIPGRSRMLPHHPPVFPESRNPSERTQAPTTPTGDAPPLAMVPGSLDHRNLVVEHPDTLGHRGCVSNSFSPYWETVTRVNSLQSQKLLRRRRICRSIIFRMETVWFHRIRNKSRKNVVMP